MDLVDKGLIASQIVLTVGYDIENLTDPERSRAYRGSVTVDRYGRRIPKHAHGTINLEKYTSSSRLILQAATQLYDEIINPSLLIRRLNIVANRVVDESSAPLTDGGFEQLSLFTNYAAEDARKEEEKAALEKERKIQEATLAIKKKFGKNAILRGMSLQEGATAKDRNRQIGGHKA